MSKIVEGMKKRKQKKKQNQARKSKRSVALLAEEKEKVKVLKEELVVSKNKVKKWQKLKVNEEAISSVTRSVHAKGKSKSLEQLLPSFDILSNKSLDI